MYDDQPTRRNPSDGYRGGGGGTNGGAGSGGSGSSGRGGYGGDRSQDRSQDRNQDRNSDRRGVPLSELDPALTAVSHKVIGAARDIHMTLAQGFDKQVYMDALIHELTTQGVSLKPNATFTPRYKGQPVGSVTADLFVDNKFLVEVMSTPGEVESWDRLRLRAKLKAADLELGLILNFGGRLMKDGLVRVLNPDKIKSLRPDEPGDAAEPTGADDTNA